MWVGTALRARLAVPLRVRSSRRLARAIPGWATTLSTTPHPVPRVHHRCMRQRPRRLCALGWATHARRCRVGTRVRMLAAAHPRARHPRLPPLVAASWALCTPVRPPPRLVLPEHLAALRPRSQLGWATACTRAPLRRTVGITCHPRSRVLAPLYTTCLLQHTCVGWAHVQLATPPLRVLQRQHRVRSVPLPCGRSPAYTRSCRRVSPPMTQMRRPCVDVRNAWRLSSRRPCD